MIASSAQTDALAAAVALVAANDPAKRFEAGNACKAAVLAIEPRAYEGIEYGEYIITASGHQLGHGPSPLKAWVAAAKRMV